MEWCVVCEKMKLKLYGAVEVQRHSFLTRWDAWIGVGHGRFAPTKFPQQLLNLSLVGTQSFSGSFDEEKTSYPCWESNHDFSDSQPVAGKRNNKCMSLWRHKLLFIRILVLVSLSAFRDDSTVCTYAVAICLWEVGKRL